MSYLVPLIGSYFVTKMLTLFVKRLYFRKYQQQCTVHFVHLQTIFLLCICNNFIARYLSVFTKYFPDKYVYLCARKLQWAITDALEFCNLLALAPLVTLTFYLPTEFFVSLNALFFI